MGVDAPSLARLSPEGVIDVNWKPSGVISARSHAVASNGDVFALGIYDYSLVAHFARFSGTFGGDLLARIYIAGSEPTTNQPRLDGIVGGKCFVQAGGGVQVLDVQRLSETNAFSVTFGDAGTITKTIALPDGGYVMIGNFNVLYGAQRYGNVLRIRADGTPDLVWIANATAIANDYISSAVFTPRGLELFGEFARVNGTSANSAKLVSIDSGATLVWGIDGTKLTNSAVFDGDGYFYQFAYSGDSQYIERVSLSNGLKDSAWSIPLLTKANQSVPAALSVDAAGGIWVFRRTESFFGEPRSTTELQRFNAATGVETFQSLAAASQRNVTSILSSPGHAYIGDLRHDLARGGVVDASWTLRPVQAGYLTRGLVARYLYFVDSETPGGSRSSPVLRRAPVAGSGTPEHTCGPPPAPPPPPTKLLSNISIASRLAIS